MNILVINIVQIFFYIHFYFIRNEYEIDILPVSNAAM